MVQRIDPEPMDSIADDVLTGAVKGTQPVVAIVGRPNVGKSSLFNRILARRHAIVSEEAGTTRDRLMTEVTWDEHRFIMVDTGGLESDPEGPIRQMAQEQADMAMSDADVIVFLTDVEDGLTPTDQEIADRLRRTNKPVILAINKVDNDRRELSAAEFYQLGMSESLPISAYHNYGIYNLMERIVSHLPEPEWVDEEEAVPATPEQLRLSIVGRTNVGKSMLLNAVLGEERSIVSDVAGTTRDALDTQINYHGQSITLIDTAGIRRPGRVEKGIEKYSVIRAVNAVDRSDITLLVTDASQLATAQDAHIAGLAWDMCRGIIVVVNKWDLMPQGRRYAAENAMARVQERLHFMPYVPICFTSALYGQGVDDLMQTARALWVERTRWIPGRQLQYLLADALTSHEPPTVKGHRGGRLRINRITQVGINPPTFLFTVNNPELIHFTYRRYLENQIRDRFGFDHTHLRLVFKRR
ncbi:MAG: ribosome biogenesis GTPase Der [Dehalococcoidia bacterium]